MYLFTGRGLRRIGKQCERLTLQSRSRDGPVVAPRRARRTASEASSVARRPRGVRARDRGARASRRTTMVFERLLADQLNARLGRVLEGVDRDDVRVGVLNGDVRIRRVRVRASALTKILDEPSARVRCGFVDELRVRVPWRNLGKEAVRVTFHGVYVVGEIDVNGDDEARGERGGAEGETAGEGVEDGAQGGGRGGAGVVEVESGGERGGFGGGGRQGERAGWGEEEERDRWAHRRRPGERSD